MNISNFKQPGGQKAAKYTQGFLTKAECFGPGPLYDDYRFNGKFIEGLRLSIQESEGTYRSKDLWNHCRNFAVMHCH